MTGYPWPIDAQLTSADLNAAFASVIASAQAAQIAASNALSLASSTASSLGPPKPVSVTIAWPSISVLAGTYVLSATLPYDLSVTSIDASVGTAGGSFSVTVRGNGLSLGLLSNLLISAPGKSNYPALTAPANPPSVGASATLDLVIASVTGTPTNAYLCVNGLRTS